MKLRSSRLPFRLLAFNIVLVFLPIAGVLFLGEYEQRLETAEIRDVTHRAQLIAATIAREGTLDENAFEDVIHRAKIDDLRVRLIDSTGRVVADSREIVAPEPQRPPRTDRRNVLYRVGAFLVRPILRFLRPPDEPLEVDYYANASRLEGPEIASVLRGREHFEKKIAQQQRSVTLYRMVPVVVGGWTVGAVVASKSTFAILQDLYVVRLRVMRIFIASLIVAILISIFFSTSIVRPLRQLRIDARAVLDRRGRLLRGAHFKGSRRLDEIGELSRALERIMRRLDAHVGYIETFAGDVVHELKNPLASIRNANEMIADVSDPADRRRFVRVIEQEVARMERLLSGVREITVIDAQLATEQPEAVDLGALLAKILDGFRLREGDRVRFQLDAGTGPLSVDANEDRLMQVFENLLDNALSFSPPGSTITASVNVEERDVVTRIADMGPGIPEANLTRIFDRFFTHRPDVSSKHSGGHTGLGLAIVRTIVEAYGGRISASNVDRGAVFTVRLPRR
ncbi:MAG TPA: ATP-binding protein [Thermoanaerobaculia bacterium]|jgi:two-component system sensor histidine kinase ChvG|nr:ATP-binding protein [Thermoanaerobaculia bacterium]